MKKAITLLLVTASMLLYGQPKQLTDQTIAESINTGVVVVEFGAEFATPFADWAKVADCRYYRLDIGKYPDVKKEYRVRSIPNIMLFNNGVKEETWKANIMLELEVTADEIQEAIQDILLGKF